MKEPTKASLQEPPTIEVNLCCSPHPGARTTDATTTILGCRASLAGLKTIHDPHCPQMQADVKARRAATARLEIEQLLVEAPASFEDIERQASTAPQTESAAAEASVSEDVGISSQSAGMTSPGKEIDDNASSEVYYQNPVAQETNWECPAALPTSDAAAEGSELAAAAAGGGAGQTKPQPPEPRECDV